MEESGCDETLLRNNTSENGIAPKNKNLAHPMLPFFADPKRMVQANLCVDIVAAPAEAV